jgi:hypothetical protein
MPPQNRTNLRRWSAVKKWEGHIEASRKGYPGNIKSVEKVTWTNIVFDRIRPIKEMEAAFNYKRQAVLFNGTADCVTSWKVNGLSHPLGGPCRGSTDPSAVIKKRNK